MATPLTPWTKAILACLDDGDWHTVSELLSVALPTIPQQRALRQTERERARQRTGEPNPAYQGDPVLRGARDIVRNTLRGMTRYGRLERDAGRYRKATS